MLIGALIALLFLSTASMPGQAFVDNISSFAKESISERDRRKEILSFTENMEDALADFSDQLKDSGTSMAKLNKDQNSTRHAFEDELNTLNNSRFQTQVKILDLRFKIKDRMSREEWNKVFKE